MMFGNLKMLWLLLVIPPSLVVFFWWSAKKKQVLMTQFIQARLLPSLTEGISPGRRKLRLALVLLGVAFLIVALARPQWGSDWEEVKVRGLDIVVAIDVSKSMLAEDISPNRLGRAKLAALDLMNQARSDRLGLVAFAGDAFLVSPLTIDESVFRQSVEALDVSTISEPGTALAAAIETALRAFKDEENHKALLLLTDGEDQDSGAVEAAKKAGAAGLTIITIGIGSAEGELLRIRDGRGRTDYIRDEQGNVVKSRLNENLLRQIAEATPNGLYVPLQGARTMESIYAQRLAPMPKSESNEKLVKRLHEQYHWPLALAILALLAEIIIPERKSRTSRNAPAGAIVTTTALVLISLLWPATVPGSPATALRDLNEGHYDQALKQYEDLLRKKGNDPRLQFNAGIAAYRGKKFDLATKEFNNAIASPDLELQKKAFYNRGNTLFQMSDLEADPKKKMETLESSLKDFQNSLGLDPRDPDAKFNYDFVKKRLEELKQQQQQQQQSKDNKDDQKKDDQKQDQNKDQNQQAKNQKDQKDPKDQKDQQSQNSQGKDDQKEGQQGKDSSGKKDDSQQAQKSDEKKDSPEQAKKKLEEEQKKQAQAAQAKEGKEGDKKDEETADAATAKGQMTQQEAQQLLDSLKGDESVIPLQSKQKRKERVAALKDW